jgi:hypothetical protein
MLSRRESIRGARLATAPRPALLVFMIAGRQHALSLGLVAAVAEIGRVTHLPSGEPLNLGLIVHRGAVLPLLDLGRRLSAVSAPGEATGTSGTSAASGPSAEGGASAESAPSAADGRYQPTPPAAAASCCIITRSVPALAFPVQAVIGLQAGLQAGLQSLPVPPDPGTVTPSWELLDRLVLDLSLGKDPAH